MAEELNHQIIDHANHDHTGSHNIINAQIIAVEDVRKIGFNLVTHAFIRASLKFIPLCANSSKYSSKIIELPIDIPANAITQIIEVALKYSLLVKYNRLYHGSIPINPKRNGNIIIPHILNPLNLIDTII